MIEKKINNENDNNDNNNNYSNNNKFSDFFVTRKEAKAVVESAANWLATFISLSISSFVHF